MYVCIYERYVCSYVKGPKESSVKSGQGWRVTRVLIG